MANPEKQPEGKVEGSAEIGEAAKEQAERLRDQAEKEKTPETKESSAEALERTKAEAEKEAAPGKEATEKEDLETEKKSVRPVSKQDKERAYDTTLTHARSHMKAPERTFSKVIHNKAVERVSEVAGRTIARPDALLGGGVVAFILTTLLYIIARTFGYPLSGFETIGTFILGFVIGFLYDFFKAMITGKKMQ